MDVHRMRIFAVIFREQSPYLTVAKSLI